MLLAKQWPGPFKLAKQTQNHIEFASASPEFPASSNSCSLEKEISEKVPLLSPEKFACTLNSGATETPMYDGRESHEKVQLDIYEQHDFLIPSGYGHPNH